MSSRGKTYPRKTNFLSIMYQAIHPWTDRFRRLLEQGTRSYVESIQPMCALFSDGVIPSMHQLLLASVKACRVHDTSCNNSPPTEVSEPISSSLLTMIPSPTDNNNNLSKSVTKESPFSRPISTENYHADYAAAVLLLPAAALSHNIGPIKLVLIPVHGNHKVLVSSLSCWFPPM